MGTLRISLFGFVQIEQDHQPKQVKLSRANQALLAYLLLFRHRLHARDTLAGLFWGDNSQEKARNCLNTALWRLRRILEPEGIPAGAYLISTTQGEIGFNSEGRYWLDVAVFEEEVGRLLSQKPKQVEAAAVQDSEEALQLYNGDLLEGFYDDWALREREHLRLQYLNAQAFLLRYYRHQGQLDKALTYGQRILDLDPLREEIHRELMRLYAANGQRSLAVRQYDICSRILEQELDIPPMAETQALYEQILQPGESISPPAVENPASNLQQALAEVNLATQAINEAYAQLQQAVEKAVRLAGEEKDSNGKPPVIQS